MAEFTPTTGQPTPKLRWYQYRLRSLLLLMLAVSLVMSAYATLRKAARAQRASVEAVLKLGGKVTYDYEKDPANPTHQPPGPPWLRKLLGNDWFVTVTRVDLGQCPISDAGLEQFQGLPRLQVLDLAWTKVSDEGLGQLDRFPRLEVLFLDGTTTSDAGLERLGGLTRLQSLSLWDTKVGDAGLKHLGRMTQLESLGLWGTNVTDAGLDHLKGLTRLRYLYLDHTKVTEAGVRELQKALPKTEIRR